MQNTFCCFVSHCSVAQNENSNNSSRHWRSIAFDIFAPPAKGGGWSQQGKRDGRRGSRQGGWSVVAWVPSLWWQWRWRWRRRVRKLLSLLSRFCCPSASSAATVAGSCCNGNGNCNCNGSNGSSSYTFAPTCCRCRCQSSTWCLCRLCEISAAHVENVCCLVASATFCCSCSCCFCLCCCCCRCRWRLLFWPRVAGNVLFMALAAIGQVVAAWISNLMLHVRYPLAACNGQRAACNSPHATIK